MPQISSSRTTRLGVEKESSWWEAQHQGARCLCLKDSFFTDDSEEGETQFEKPWSAEMQKGLKVACKAALSLTIVGK